MGQEFTIKSQQIEDKINQLLPSQGGFAPGVDFSASTTVIPIVDLTETAEGSGLRVDLQSALSHKTANVFNVNNADTTVINTTGYYRITGTASIKYSNTTREEVASIKLNDGATTKIVWAVQVKTDATTVDFAKTVDYICFLPAGNSIIIGASSVDVRFIGSIRQLADINGNLIDP